MRAELKAKWIAALRSGDYQQCRRVLHEKDSYCCLGVELAVIHGFTANSNGCGFVDLRTSAPWDDILASDGVTRDALLALVEMNDSGKSFSEIADWIETNVPAESAM